MNLRLFSIGILVSAIPLLSSAEGSISFNRGDFTAAEKLSKDGEAILSVKLSKSGKAKVKRINERYVEKNIHVSISGVEADLRVKEPIHGDTLEIGPFSASEAQTVISEVIGSKK